MKAYSSLEAYQQFFNGWVRTCYLLEVSNTLLLKANEQKYLKSVPSAKYLGVTISEDLKWSEHINNITKKANQTLGFLKRNIRVHNKDLKSTAYKTLVRPQLEYASTVWSPHTDLDINKLESVQRRAARWVTRDYQYTSSVSSMLQDLNWRTLDQRRIDSRLVLLYKVTYDLVAIPASDYLIRNTRPSSRNHPIAYRQITTLKDFYKFTFFPRTIIHWNALPHHIPTLPTFLSFFLSNVFSFCTEAPLALTGV